MNKGRIVAGLLVAGAAVSGALVDLEGEGRVVYADKLAGGIPTVCAGHTDWKLRVGTPYTKEECAKLNAKNLEKYGLAIMACAGHTDENRVLNQNQYDAFTLFAVNVGIQGACGSRAMRLTKAGNLEAGCRAIATGPNGEPVWSYVNKTQFVRGLHKRRMFERDWCLRPPPEPERVEIPGPKRPAWVAFFEAFA